MSGYGANDSAAVAERFGKNWSPEEERSLLDGYRTHGPNWDIIQSLLPQRKGIVSKWKRLVATGNTEAIELQKMWRLHRDKMNDDGTGGSPGESSGMPAGYAPTDEHHESVPQPAAKRSRRTDPDATGHSGQYYEPPHGAGASSSGSGIPHGSGPNLSVGVPTHGGAHGQGVGHGQGSSAAGSGLANITGLGMGMGFPASMAPPSSTHAVLQARRDMGHASQIGPEPPLLGVKSQGAGASGHGHGSMVLRDHEKTKKRTDMDHVSPPINGHNGSSGSNMGSLVLNFNGVTAMGQGLGLGLGLEFGGMGYNSASNTPSGAAAIAHKRNAVGQPAPPSPRHEGSAGRGMATGAGASAGAGMGALDTSGAPTQHTYMDVTVNVRVPVPILPVGVFPDPVHAEQWITEYARAYAEHYAHAYASTYGDAHVHAFRDYGALPHVRTALAARQAAHRHVSGGLGVDSVANVPANANMAPEPAPLGEEGSMSTRGITASTALPLGMPLASAPAAPTPLSASMGLGLSIIGNTTGGGALAPAVSAAAANNMARMGLASLVEAVEESESSGEKVPPHAMATGISPAGVKTAGLMAQGPLPLMQLVSPPSAGQPHKAHPSAGAGSDGADTIATAHSGPAQSGSGAGTGGESNHGSSGSSSAEASSARASAAPGSGMAGQGSSQSHGQHGAAGDVATAGQGAAAVQAS